MIYVDHIRTVSELDPARVGKFEIDRKFLDKPDDLYAIAELFKGMVVVRAELVMFGSRFGEVISYTAIHPSFDKVPTGSPIPFYEAQITTLDGKVAKIEWINTTAQLVADRLSGGNKPIPCGQFPCEKHQA
jgi:hypothetical protein